MKWDSEGVPVKEVCVYIIVNVSETEADAKRGLMKIKFILKL